VLTRSSSRQLMASSRGCSEPCPWPIFSPSIDAERFVALGGVGSVMASAGGSCGPSGGWLDVARETLAELRARVLDAERRASEYEREVVRLRALLALLQAVLTQAERDG
jgi:hypothetical protein